MSFPSHHFHHKMLLNALNGGNDTVLEIFQTYQKQNNKKGRILFWYASDTDGHWERNYINWRKCEMSVLRDFIEYKVHIAHIVDETSLDIIKTQQWWYQRDMQGKELSKDSTEQVVNYSPASQIWEITGREQPTWLLLLSKLKARKLMHSWISLPEK